MYKTIMVYSVAPGTNPDAFWKYVTEVHAIDINKVAGPILKKSVFNQITEVKTGETKLYGISEKWWESKEAQLGYANLARNYRSASGKTPPEDFLLHGGITVWNVSVEEKEIPV